MELNKEEFKNHLIEKIIPFWKNLKDNKNGGYYGYMDINLKIDKNFSKGCILNSRILWFFSNAYTTLKDESLLEYAEHAYYFLKNSCLDNKNGGVYWAVTYDGKEEDTTKHTYNQAFAIYALSSYYEVTKDKEALDIAYKLYNLIEKKCRDELGYKEAFTIDFKPKINEKLSENGVIAEKTMNTLLHILEAYTELYRVDRKEEVANKLKVILNTLKDKVYNKKLGRQEVFFDREWNSLIDLYSFGHDIETAWLVDRTLEIINDEKYTKELSKITRELTKNIYEVAYRDSSLLNEAECGKLNTKRIWWVQAEAVIGFYNGYEKTKNKKYLEASINIWEYIKEFLVDKRDESEWFWSLDDNRKPSKDPIVEPWKCPYHNGRMCFEIINR